MKYVKAWKLLPGEFSLTQLEDAMNDSGFVTALDRVLCDWKRDGLIKRKIMYIKRKENEVGGGGSWKPPPSD